MYAAQDSKGKIKIDLYELWIPEPTVNPRSGINLFYRLNKEKPISVNF